MDREAAMRVDGASRINELPHKMIEGAPHVVDGIPSYQSDVGRGPFFDIDVKRATLGLRIVLTQWLIWLAGEEPLDSGVEVVDVMFGPVRTSTGWRLTARRSLA